VSGNFSAADLTLSSAGSWVYGIGGSTPETLSYNVNNDDVWKWNHAWNRYRFELNGSDYMEWYHNGDWHFYGNETDSVILRNENGELTVEDSSGNKTTLS